MRAIGTGVLISMRLLPLVLLLGLTACAELRQILGTETPPLPVSDGESTLPFCLAAKPITYSVRTDSKETIVQIREHNAVGVALKCRAWKAQQSPP